MISIQVLLPRSDVDVPYMWPQRTWYQRGVGEWLEESAYILSNVIEQHRHRQLAQPAAGARQSFARTSIVWMVAPFQMLQEVKEGVVI